MTKNSLYRISVRLPLLAGLLFLISPGQGQPAIQRAIDALARAPELQHGSLGVCVIDAESGELVAGHQSDLGLIPASTLKVVTTATALAVLGADYRYVTTLAYDGSLEGEGRLRGNLYISGTGDPTLGSDQLEGTADLKGILQKFRLAVQQGGIRQIAGAVVGDGSYLPGAVTPPSWQWADLGNYYAAGVWGLNIHENLFYLRFQQAPAPGATPAVALIEPEVPGLEMRNEVTSAGRNTGDNAYIFGGPYHFQRYVRGTIPVGSGRFSIKGSLPDAPLFAAQHLALELERVGIRAGQGALSHVDLARRGGATGGRRTTLLTHLSAPLSAIVYRANQKSVNLYCEALLRTVGKHRRRDGSLEASLEAVADEWRQRGLSLAGIHLADGSGLSARNAVTPRFLAGVLSKSARDPRIFDILYESLPVIGGTAGRVRAKSGTIDRVRAFAGYARTPAGKLLAFSIMANNFEGSGIAMRRRLEELMQTMSR